MATDLNSYGSYIGSIIIMMVFLIGIIIIIDELYNITKFCYRYIYLYNYGKANETACKESKLEYETARFRIYNEIANYKFNKDLFTKSWFNYSYLICVLIMTILLCISFGYIFKYFFIDNNPTCSMEFKDNDKESTVGWSPIKLLMRCFCGDCHKYVPNCLTNYIMLFIIIFIYPLIYILKVAIKMDLTWSGGSFVTKLLHTFFFCLLIFYVYYLYSEEEYGQNKDNKGFMKPKYFNIIIYLIFVTVFYANNYLFDSKFAEYNNLSLMGNTYYKTDFENDDVDTMFFDIYKQEEPIKPLSLSKPEFLADFKYCTKTELSVDSKNSYCSDIKKLELSAKPYPRLNESSYKCLYNSTSDPTMKAQIDKYLKSRDFYAIDKLIIDDYYKKLKKYDSDLQSYNIKYNIYKNNKIEFPEVVYLLFHMCPKLTGIDKTDVQLLLILIVIVVLLTFYLRMNNNPHTDYVYYTIYLYLLGMISITVLVNAILTYNTYVNKYLIYEPIHNYKNSLYNKNIIFNMIINQDDKLIELYKLNSNKFNDKISSVSLLPSEYKYKVKTQDNSAPQTVTLGNFVNRITKKPTDIDEANDFYNLNSPEPPKPQDFTNNLNTPTSNDYLFNIQIKFYKVIYSFMLYHNRKAKDISNLDDKIKSYFIINRPNPARNDNYVKFNYYKNANLDTIPYISVPTDQNLLRETNQIEPNILYFLRLIMSMFVNSEQEISKKINQLKLNMDYYIYNNYKDYNIGSYNNLPATDITFEKLIDKEINYKEAVVQRDNKDPTIIDIIKNYKYNYSLIQDAFAIYAEFLKDFRKQIVRLFNTCGVSCDDTNYIDIINKFEQFKRKLFTVTDSKDDSKLRFKSSRQEPNIEIYKRVLLNTMNVTNASLTKTMNIMKIYIRSFKTTSSSSISDSILIGGNSIISSSKKFTNFKEGEKLSHKDIIDHVILNYNIYNMDSENHNNERLIKKTFNIEPNYKKSKYDKFDDIDIKKLKKSSDNISLSFFILIIIFAIILIEPTVI
jgi:hypothetical protein